ncbi:hypothetical protein NDU88_003965 [Pleurodeles waltl]|uniref:Uncharacterized protein n=1 Tax=Pleurodeles waltl TaxID=8319 RepID=A0AAV7W3W8_PLEWA|nr:hypothetical protein NDU88_003965 [Pleurodeles waltl]
MRRRLTAGTRKDKKEDTGRGASGVWRRPRTDGIREHMTQRRRCKEQAKEEKSFGGRRTCPADREERTLIYQQRGSHMKTVPHLRRGVAFSANTTERTYEKEIGGRTRKDKKEDDTGGGALGVWR